MSDSGGEAEEAEQPRSPESEPSSSESHQARELAVALRNGLRLGASLVLTWGVALLVKLQIPAQLGPIRQGQFAFAESFAMIFFSVISLGVDVHVIKEVPVRPAYASEFVGGVFALRTLLSAGLLVVMGLALVLTGRSEEVLTTALVFGVAQLFISINGTLASVLQAVSHVGRLALANIFGKVIWGGALLAGLIYRAPMWALAVPLVAGEVLKAAVLFPTAAAAASLRYRIDAAAVRKAVRASVPFFVNSVAVTFGNYLALSALEFIRHDEREVGWFSASQNVAGLAMLLHPILGALLMPMLSRAQARSNEEMISILRRAIEGLLILVAPGTVFISAGADILIGLAFGEQYAPASLGLSILSLVFLMTYMNIMLAAALILGNRGWSVTVISASSVCLMSVLMLICVPAGRVLFGEGGECAGAAIAVIASEAAVVVAMFSRFDQSPLDSRNIAVLTKSVAISAVVLVLNHVIKDMGAWRLLVVMSLYVVLAWATRVVRPEEIAGVVRMLRAQRSGKV